MSILRMVVKRKISIGITWILLTTLALGIVWKIPSVYSAEAVILVDSQKIPEKFVSATVATDLQERIATIKQQIMSSTKLKKIIDDFGLYREERKTHVEEEILEMMRKDISITVEKDPLGTNRNAPLNAFRVGYQGANPGLVAEVANRLSTFYIDENLKTREVQAEGTSDFLHGQLEEAKKRLDQLEAAVSSYKLRFNGELPEQQQNLTGSLARLQVELEANRDGINRAQQTKLILENSLNTAEASLAALTRALTQTPAPELGDPVVPAVAASQPAQKKKSEILQEELDLLRTRYSDTHPDVVRVRAALESVKREEARTAAATPTPAAPATKSTPSAPRPTTVASARDAQELIKAREQVSSLRAQIKVAEKDMADRLAAQDRILREIRGAQSHLEKLPVREQEMAQITRDYEISKTNYKALLDKKLAAEMALDMERRQKSERFTVIDAAKVPEIPIKPKRPLLYAIGSVASLVIAFVVGFVREARQNVVLGEWELPEDCVVLARLPYIEISSPGSVAEEPPGRGKRAGRKRLLASFSAAVLSLAGLIAAGLYYFHWF